MANGALPGGETAHVDAFARDNLPPSDTWPVMDFSKVPELAAYGDRLNATVALLDAQIAAGGGERPALIFEGEVWSYADLQRRVDQIARVLTEDMGLVSGNRVLLRGANTPMMAACWYAVVKAGGICVATMPLLRARELAYIVEKSQATIALCDADLSDELEKVNDRSGGALKVGFFSSLGADTAAEVDRLAAGKQEPFTAVDTAADDVALIAFTSGTTGRPKGTVHFHRDVLAMSDCFPRYTIGLGPEDVCIGSPPLAFTFGLGALLTFPMRMGASTVYYSGPPAPSKLAELIETHRATTLYTAPTMYRALLEVVDDHDISSLRTCVSAGEHLPKPTWEAWRDKTGLPIVDGIGSTEMIHIFVSTPSDAIRPGATGKAIPGYEARVEDDAGNPLPPGEPGQLAVRGPTGCRYLADPDRQRAYVRDGWNHPGDVFIMDEDGYFWYQARADDMIISSGYNISGPEVETVLLDHPKVKECACVASPDPDRGHVVKAFVVLHDQSEAGDATASELQEFVKSEIAPYKYPRAVEFVGSLPYTETGKVQRFKLREMEEQAQR